MDPGLLIASPQMRDPNFARSVVLLVQHDENGALGVVINRELSVPVRDVLEGAEDATGPSGEQRALWGGPVQPEIGLVVFEGEAPEGWRVGEQLAVSGSRERVMALLRQDGRFHLCLGYAGWGPGQLDREFAEGSWVHSEADRRLLFEVNAARRYDEALARLGLRAETLWMTPIDE